MNQRTLNLIMMILIVIAVAMIITGVIAYTIEYYEGGIQYEEKISIEKRG